MNRTTRSQSLYTLAFVVGISVAISILPWTAFAEDIRTIDVQIEGLIVQHDGDDLIVESQINRRDWDRMYREGVAPELHLWAPIDDVDEFYQRISLDERHQRVVVPANGQAADLNEVEIFFDSGDTEIQIDNITLHRTQGPALIIDILPEDAVQIPLESRSPSSPTVTDDRIRQRFGTSRTEQRLEQRRWEAEQRFTPGPSRTEERLEQRRRQTDEHFTPGPSRTEERLEQRRQQTDERLPSPSDTGGDR